MRTNNRTLKHLGWIGGCLGGCLLWGTMANLGRSLPLYSNDNPNLESEVLSTIAPNTDVTTTDLYQLAQTITVKLWVADNNWGSGVLIARSGQSYTVLTNRHVLNAGTTYQIETGDRQRYEATVPNNQPFGSHDIAIVQFTSNTTYPIATLTETSLMSGDTVMAAGYPIDDDPSQSPGFAAVLGQVEIIIPQSMAGGYQIGSDIAIAKGMSGGPLLNLNGEVTGINGLHQYPLWGNPYVFDDGSLPSAIMQAQMQHYSWAIPIRLILLLLH